MPPVQKAIALALLTAATLAPVARCEEAISRLPDGRYLVQVNGVTVALPEDDPHNKHIGFYVSTTPPGTSPFHFYLTDLVRDPDRYVARMQSSEWSSVGAWASYDRPREILGVPVVKGVYGVEIHSGVDRNCEGWQSDWARYREAATNMPSDQYGWIRQDNLKSPPTSMFIKFLEGGERLTSRYYAVNCDFSGGCSTWACHGRVTARISFQSSNKIQGEDYNVGEFDQQIASGIKVLERMLVNRLVDLSHP